MTESTEAMIERMKLRREELKKKMSDDRFKQNEDVDEIQYAARQSSPKSPGSEAEATASCKRRLAALAEGINNWEDESRRKTSATCEKDCSSPKKTSNRKSPVAKQPATTNIPNANKFIATSPVWATKNHKSQGGSAAGFTSSTVSKSNGLVKRTGTAFEAASTGDVGYCRLQDNELTRDMIGGYDNDKEPMEGNDCAETVTIAGPVTKKVKNLSNGNVVSSISIVLGKGNIEGSRQQGVALDCVTMTVGKPSNQANGVSSDIRVDRPNSSGDVRRRSGSRRSEEHEPTRQSVSARRAVWQTKTSGDAKCPSVSGLTLGAKQASSYGRSLESVAELGKENSPMMGKKSTFKSVNCRNQFGSNAGDKADNAQAVASMTAPVMAKSAVTGTVPTKAGSRIGMLPKSPPKRVAPGTAVIQERLARMLEDGWKKNDIASRSKQQRMTEICALEERWKSGGSVPDEEEKAAAIEMVTRTFDGPTQECKQSSRPQPSVPSSSLIPPPPLPPPAPPLRPSSCIAPSTKRQATAAELKRPTSASYATSTVSSGFQKQSQTSNATQCGFVAGYRKPAMKKMSSAAILQSMNDQNARSSKTKSRICKKEEKFHDRLVDDFESNLIAMGFEVTEDSEDGTAATVDFTANDHAPTAKTTSVKGKVSERVPSLATKRPIRRSVTATTIGSQAKTPAVGSNLYSIVKKQAYEAKGASLTSLSDHNDNWSESETVSKSHTPAVASSTDDDSFESLATNAAVELRSKGAQLAVKELVPGVNGNGLGKNGVDRNMVGMNGVGRNVVNGIAVENNVVEENMMRMTSMMVNDEDRDTYGVIVSSSCPEESAGDDEEDEVTSSDIDMRRKKKHSKSKLAKCDYSTLPTGSGSSRCEPPRARHGHRPSKRHVQFSYDTATGSDTDASDLSISPPARPTADCSSEGIYMDMTPSKRCQSRNADFGDECSAAGVDDYRRYVYAARKTDEASKLYKEKTSVEMRVKNRPISDMPSYDRNRAASTTNTDYYPQQHQRPFSDQPATYDRRREEHELTARSKVGAFLARRSQARLVGPINPPSPPPPRREAPTLTDPIGYKSIRLQLYGLQEMVKQEEGIALQASNALSVCIKKSIISSVEAIECHRLLLSASLRRETLLVEMKRLREENETINVIGRSGRFTASEIRLPLKPEFMAKLGTVHDTSVHYFVVVLRTQLNVVASRVISTQESMVLSSLALPGVQLHLKRIPEDFHILLEIFTMTVSRERQYLESCGTPTKKSRRPTTQRELLTPRSDSRERAISTGVHATEFIPIASLELDRESLGRVHFALKGIAYANPLQGTIHMKLKHTTDACIQLRGFLSIYLADRDKWSRRWCILDDNLMLMWRYTSEEMYKEPLYSIDLRLCINEEISSEVLAEDHEQRALEIITVKPLIGRTNGAAPPPVGGLPNRMHNHESDIIRHWLLADSEEECELWCDRLNGVLQALRSWHPYSVPSVNDAALDP